MAAEESLTYSRVLVTAYETICRNLDLKTVGDKLTEGKELPKELRKRIRYAVKKEDKQTFHALLISMNMKSFVFFLEVLHSIRDEKHKEILKVLSQQLQQLSLEGVSEEVVARLQFVTTKYLPGGEMVSQVTRAKHSKSEVAQSSLITPPVLYLQHPVETASFSRAQQNTFYSSMHDITVVMEPGAFLKNLDALKLFLTVSDYSRSVCIPDGYHGMYSVLLSLKSDPHVEAFGQPVTVTVPHSAVGGLEKLCVLTGAEEEDMLHEDPNILIECVDKKYLTFQTLHFSKYMLASYDYLPAKETRAKNRLRIQQLPYAFEKMASLDETLMRPVLPPLPSIPRSYSCPARDVSHTDTIFVAALFTPHDTSVPHWKFTIIVIDHLPTHYDVST